MKSTASEMSAHNTKRRWKFNDILLASEKMNKENQQQTIMYMTYANRHTFD